MIVCHVCGTENPDGAKFCEGCGVELSAPVAMNTGDLAAPVTPASMPPVAETPAFASAAPIELPPFEAPTSEPPTPAAPVLFDAPADSAPIEVAADNTPLEVPSEQPSPATSIEMPLEQILPPAAVVSEPDIKATMPDTMLPIAQPPVVATVAATNTPTVARLVPRAIGATPSDGYVLNNANMVVGRFDPSAGPVDIDLGGQTGEGYISRRHAEVFLQDGAWMVRDLGSTNGVYIKKAGQGQYSPRLIEPAALSDGDEVAFGNVKFLFQNSSAA